MTLAACIATSASVSTFSIDYSVRSARGKRGSTRWESKRLASATNLRSRDPILRKEGVTHAKQSKDRGRAIPNANPKETCDLHPHSSSGAVVLLRPSSFDAHVLHGK